MQLTRESTASLTGAIHGLQRLTMEAIDIKKREYHETMDLLADALRAGVSPQAVRTAALIFYATTL